MKYNRIAAYFGVSSVFMVDSGKSGGLSNEGMQILLTNRAVEFGQKTYTDVLFPKLLKQMGVMIGNSHFIRMKKKMKLLDYAVMNKNLNVAQRMTQLGFTADLIDGDPAVIFDSSIVNLHLNPAAPPGGAPPLGGGAPPPMMPPGGGMPPP